MWIFSWPPRASYQFGYCLLAHNRIAFNFWFPYSPLQITGMSRVPLPLCTFSLRIGLYFYLLLRVWITTLSLPKMFSTSLMNLLFSISYYDYLHSFYCLIRGCMLLKSSVCDSSLYNAPQYLHTVKGLKGCRKSLSELKRPFSISFNNHSY